MTAVVYRVYDASDRLIYVGASSNLSQRLAYHSSNAWWWALAKRITHEPQPDMDAAFRSEERAIAVEQPAFNIAKKRGRASSRPFPLSEADVQVCRDWLASKKRGAYLPMALWWVLDAHQSALRAA